MLPPLKEIFSREYMLWQRLDNCVKALGKAVGERTDEDKISMRLVGILLMNSDYKFEHSSLLEGEYNILIGDGHKYHLSADTTDVRGSYHAAILDILRKKAGEKPKSKRIESQTMRFVKNSCNFLYSMGEGRSGALDTEQVKPFVESVANFYEHHVPNMIVDDD